MELCQKVLTAIGEVDSIEKDMDAEEVELHLTYQKDVEDCKLSFEACYRFIADNLDDVLPMFDVERELFEGIQKDAKAVATPEADAAAEADPAPAFVRQHSQ